ncbi:phosphomannomutase [Rhodobacteraceae bacterium DSL-40]|uniref:phosphomannomutase n=1 Tax=Amaricoccus sp. B4 TaxID=3368557 RepID=UPI000DACD155
MEFGTSGLRGLVTEMTEARVAAHVAAFLHHLDTLGLDRSILLTGRDLRPSSPRIADACLAMAQAMGSLGIDCGVLPSPALALEAATRGLPAIMVTGSHIPFDRNGLKFYRPGGEITKADEACILAALESPAPALRPAAVTAETDGGAAARRYQDRYLGFFAPDTLADKRIGLYQHSAAGRDLMVPILEGLGATVIPFGRSEGFIPIDTEAVRPEDADLARDVTRAERLDAMISSDGDGDRPLMADETGRILRGDTLGLLTARLLGADAVATPVSSNTALERSGWFGRIARTRIGSPHVIAAMETLAAQGARCVAGYEANGGFLFGGRAEDPVTGAHLGPLVTRDAMPPLLAPLVMAAREGRTLSELAASLPSRFTASGRLPEFPKDRSSPLLVALARDATARATFLDRLGLEGAGQPDTLDGVRLPLAEGEILHLRASGNAPELRCYAEAAAEDRAEALVAATLGTLAADQEL